MSADINAKMSQPMMTDWGNSGTTMNVALSNSVVLRLTPSVQESTHNLPCTTRWVVMECDQPVDNTTGGSMVPSLAPNEMKVSAAEGLHTE